jgi:hypothetical protein
MSIGEETRSALEGEAGVEVSQADKARDGRDQVLRGRGWLPAW